MDPLDWNEALHKYRVSTESLLACLQANRCGLFWYYQYAEKVYIDQAEMNPLYLKRVPVHEQAKAVNHVAPSIRVYSLAKAVKILQNDPRYQKYTYEQIRIIVRKHGLDTRASVQLPFKLTLDSLFKALDTVRPTK